MGSLKEMQADLTLASSFALTIIAEMVCLIGFNLGIKPRKSHSMAFNG